MEKNLDKINRPDRPSKIDLEKLYDVCNEIFKNESCFYTKEEFKEIKRKKEKLC